MKNLIISLSIVLSSTLLANELSWVNEQVEAIKPTRSGMSKKSIRIIKDPFIFLEKNRLTERKEVISSVIHSPVTNNVSRTAHTSTQTTRKNTVHVANTMLSLRIIMNSSVMINGEWYKVGDRISGYKIKKINRNSVLLLKNSKKLLLSTKSNSKKLKFQK